MNGDRVAVDGGGLRTADVAKSSHFFGAYTYGIITHSQTAHALNLT